MVFVGTPVVSGTAIAEVVATGPHTAFSDVAARLSERAPETAFDLGLRRFGYLITRFVFGLVLFVLLMSLTLHRPAFESLLFAVSLAVGLTPEFLPMITSVTLSRGALAMARKQVIVKRLPAIQNLGSIDILCSDKTGTLTSDVLELHASLGPDGKPSSRALAAARINSQQQTGIRSPLDTAILATPTDGLSMPRKLDEIPFDFQRRRLSVVVEREGKNILICKGSPEGILPLVTAVAYDNREAP
jgi:Mg2+-importing ATPase